MSIIITILMLSVLIVVHEFGHFIVARLNGVQVEEFSLGMGPLLYKKCAAKSGTQYSLRLFPIGGYVKMLGEEGDEPEEPADLEKAFYTKSIWRRMAVIAAGPLMNFVIAVPFFIIAFAGLGVPSNEPVVGVALEGGAGFAAGLEDGDRVLAIDGQPMETWQQLAQTIRDSEGREMTLEVERDGQRLTINATAELDAAQDAYLLSIQQAVERRSILSAVKMGFTETYQFTKQILVSFVGMFTGQIEAELTGPVGMTTVVGQIAQNGVFQLLLFFGVLSINLGIVNLFPLPALDGGRLFFMLIEALRGRPVDPSKENMVHLIGLVALMCLMVVITYQDIMRLIGS